MEKLFEHHCPFMEALSEVRRPNSANLFFEGDDDDEDDD